MANLRFGWQAMPGAVSQLIEQAVICEKQGFDAIWFMDHLIGEGRFDTVPELYVSLTAMGLKTDKIAVGPDVTDPLRRHPAVTAQAAASLDNLLGGRTLMGIGAGARINLAPFGISLENLYGKLREGLQVMKLLWSATWEKPASFQGKYFQLENAYLQIQSVTKPHPPIYLGAFGPKMLQLTGEMADGWIPFSHTPQTYKETLGVVQAAARSAGRAADSVTPGLCPFLSISNDASEAHQRVEKVAKAYLLMAPDILAKIAPEIVHPGWRLPEWGNSEDYRVTRRKLMAQIPSDLALQTVVSGTPADCIKQIEGFASAGVQHFIFYPSHGMDLAKIREELTLFGEKVVPYFR